jgi:uncharacterized protein (TIGR02996 family)
MATRDELEAAIDADPDRVDNYLVLGDWLQEHQDPRGELIALMHARNGRAALLQRELGPPAPRNGSLDWQHGFVRSVRAIMNEDDDVILEQLLDHPSCRHLQSLQLEIAGRQDDDRQWVIDVIAAAPRRCLRALHVYSYWRGGNDPPAGELDLSTLWTALPRLATCYAGARYLTASRIRSATLTRLELDGEVVSGDVEPVVVAEGTPNLRELVLHDVDPAACALVLQREYPALGSQLTTLQLPHAIDAIADRIRRWCPAVTFAPPDDGDRYEQTGE